MTLTREDSRAIWQQALAAIEIELSQANFNTWFKNTYIQKCDDDVVHVAVPNTFVRDWMYNKYQKLILRYLRELNSGVRGCEFIVEKSEDKTKREERSPSFSNAPVGQIDMGEIYTNREDNLNPKYLFDSFIVASFNELAHAAAQAVSKNPGKIYNPLFVYGGSGLGKTHLLQAMGNQIKKLNSNKKIYYVSLERFSNDFVDAMKSNRIQAFKDKYRKFDVLIMDDVQFLSKKESTQNELFHLFNNFYESNKQLVFSSDKPPKQIPDIEERVRTRFGGGMIADIGRPDYETRMAILRSKTRNIPYCPGDDILEHIAVTVTESIRELEGALNALICQAQLKMRPLSAIEARSLLKNSGKQQKTISIKDVITLVADFYNINEQDLYEKTRRKEVVKPRQVIMYLLREDFSASYPFIGNKLGGRDHTTVIHAYEKIKGDIKVDNVLNQEIEKIKTLLYADSPRA